MKRSEIYRKAAEMIDARRETYSCFAILRAQALDTWLQSPERTDYEDYFRPNRHEGNQLFRLAWGENWSDYTETVRSCRVLSLLFMASIAKSEGE